jgi:hypothetical protein
MVKDYIDKFKYLVDYFIIQYPDGEEEEILSEDAEFLDEDFMERSVMGINVDIDYKYCMICLEN